MISAGDLAVDSTSRRTSHVAYGPVAHRRLEFLLARHPIAGLCPGPDREEHAGTAEDHTAVREVDMRGARGSFPRRTAKCRARSSSRAGREANR